jgi:thiamine biosynthesis protein ThiI
VSGQVGLLLSGGIDSPVAGHLMQKRGSVLHPFYFHSFPYTGERTRAKVAQLAGVLRRAQEAMALNVIPFTEVQIAIRDNCPRELAVVLYRRMMMRIASRLAQQRRCVALATGENLGQVASQTLENLACIEQAADLPVLRPLLTYDKAETIELARRIGTYELSIAPYDDCCSLFVPKHPATKAKPTAAAAAEQALDLPALVDQAVEGVERVEV